MELLIVVHIVVTSPSTALDKVTQRTISFHINYDGYNYNHGWNKKYCYWWIRYREGSLKDTLNLNPFRCRFLGFRFPPSFQMHLHRTFLQGQFRYQTRGSTDIHSLKNIPCSIGKHCISECMNASHNPCCHLHEPNHSFPASHHLLAKAQKLLLSRICKSNVTEPKAMSWTTTMNRCECSIIGMCNSTLDGKHQLPDEGIYRNTLNNNGSQEDWLLCW